MMPCHLIPGAEEVDADDMETQVEDIPTEEGEGELGPQAQVILTGCWLTMKEVGLLMGSLATYASLPGTYQFWLMHSDWPPACQATDVCTAIAGRPSQQSRLYLMSQIWHWPLAFTCVMLCNVSCMQLQQPRAHADIIRSSMPTSSMSCSLQSDHIKVCVRCSNAWKQQ